MAPSSPDHRPEVPGSDETMVVADHPHDFDVQKRIHRQIRNDPDYDDWEYGTEPLPHEAWGPSRSEPPASAPPG